MHAVKWEVLSSFLIGIMLFVSMQFLAVKGFCKIFLSLWIDGVRNDSNLTNLHMCLIFDVRVVLGDKKF